MVLQKYMKPADKKVQEWKGQEWNGMEWTGMVVFFSVRETGFYDTLRLFRAYKGDYLCLTERYMKSG